MLPSFLGGKGCRTLAGFGREDVARLRCLMACLAPQQPRTAQRQCMLGLERPKRDAEPYHG